MIHVLETVISFVDLALGMGSGGAGRGCRQLLNEPLRNSKIDKSSGFTAKRHKVLGFFCLRLRK